MTELHVTKLSFTNTKTIVEGVRYHPGGAEETAKIQDNGSDKDLEAAASKMIQILVKYNRLTDDWLDAEITSVSFNREDVTLASVAIAAKLFVTEAEPPYSTNAKTPSIGATWFTPQEDLLVNALLAQISRYVDSVPKQQSLELQPAL